MTPERELLAASEEELREVDEFLARVHDAEQGPEPVEEVE